MAIMELELFNDEGPILVNADHIVYARPVDVELTQLCLITGPLMYVKVAYKKLGARFSQF